VIGVITGLIQGRTGVFAERMQGQHLYILGYSVSVFSNSVSMLIVTLGLSGYSNRYRTTVAVIYNNHTRYPILLGQRKRVVSKIYKHSPVSKLSTNDSPDNQMSDSMQLYLYKPEEDKESYQEENKN
jgi:hypothetical protein